MTSWSQEPSDPDSASGAGRHEIAVLAPAILLGGAAGTLLRDVLERSLAAATGWPWVTFGINLTGSFLLGWLLASLSARGDDSGRRRLVRLALGTGVLGGFTTYSTFVVEIDRLIGDGSVASAMLYPIASILLGLVAAGAGVMLGGARRQP